MSMQFNVAGLLKAPIGERRDFELDDTFSLGEPDVTVVAPVIGRVRLTRDHAGILVQAKLHTRLAQECARCLAQTESDVALTLDEEFWPTVYIPGGPPVSRTDEDHEAETAIDMHHGLDLAEVVRQAILLEVPSHPLCRPDCKGLCPTCGQDLNSGPCACPPGVDERWATLKGLLGDQV